MTSGIVYAIAALVCYGVADLIYKRAANAGIPAAQFLTGQTWLFCPAAVAYAWFTGTLQFSMAALWGAVAALFLVVGYYNFTRSLRTGAVGIIAPIYRLNFFITVALAVGWLREPLTVQKQIGFVLAVAAGWLLLSVSFAQRGQTAADRRSLVEVVVAAVATGFANFCYKLGLIGGALPETILATQAIVYCTVFTLLAWWTHGTTSLPTGFVRHSGPAAIVLLAAFLFLLHALKRADASTVIPITQMGFVIAAILGSLFLAEPWTGRKIIGICAATAALLIMATG